MFKKSPVRTGFVPNASAIGDPAELARYTRLAYNELTKAAQKRRAVG
jgi:hypothetical protein